MIRKRSWTPNGQNGRNGIAFYPVVIFVLLLSSCATYYQRHYDFNTEFEKGDLKSALETLQQKEGRSTGKDRFLHYVNQGLLLSVLGKYEESNAWFEKAFLFGEDYHINYFHEAASYLSNPNMTIYRGEDHEHLMLLYFKALNYLKLQKSEEALVECRRLNIRLNQLSDKYASPRKFRRDAFVHNLMGIIYQSTGDFNNAFIAYRNALEIYREDYADLFHVDAPQQLKADLLNTAWWTGFTEEFELYRDQFGMHDYTPARPEAELVFFWHNGLSPVKTEWSLNFMIDHQSENLFVFSNPALGVHFPFRVEDKEERNDLSRLEFFRVAFPRYSERPMYYGSACLRKDSTTYPLELSEDISKIAFHSLQQRMMLEFSKGLLRAALKKAAEHSLRKEDDRLGALIGVVNAITEKADTRNWQTLPHSIYYARVPLQAGKNEIAFSLQADPDKADYSFTYQAQRNQTLFHTFSSLETSTGVYRPY